MIEPSAISLQDCQGTVGEYCGPEFMPMESVVGVVIYYSLTVFIGCIWGPLTWASPFASVVAVGVVVATLGAIVCYMEPSGPIQRILVLDAL